MLRRIAAQGGLHRLPEARRRNGRHPARRRPQRPRFRGAPAGGVLAVASGERPCRDRARLDPAQRHGSRASGQGDLRAVANPQRPRRPNPARLRHQRARFGRGTRKGDFLAGPAALPGERRLPARPVREADRGGLEGEGDLLALPDGRRRQRALADGHRAQRTGAGGDAEEGALLGRSDRRKPGAADRAVRPNAEPGNERAADLRVLAAPRGRGARSADPHREGGAGQGAPQESHLLARPVPRPPRRPGAAGDHQSVTGRLVLAWALVAGPAAAQRLGARVAAAPDGTVRLSFAARPGVCGDGHHVIALDCAGGRCGRRGWGHTITFDGGFDGDEVEYDCEPGPVRVSLTVRTGQVRSLRTYVGGHWVTPSRDAAVTDLGTVSPRDAVDFLLDLATREDTRGGEEAILPVTLADSVIVWPMLLKLARDDRAPRRTRHQAVFWLGQAAGDAATRGLADLVDDGDVDRDVKEQAVFALSQQPRDAGVPALIRIARTHPERGVRRKALFWLGQSDDPRALGLFEELLTKP